MFLPPRRWPPALAGLGPRDMIALKRERPRIYFYALEEGGMKITDGHRRDRSWALLFARLVLGLIFFMAGAWKVFQLGPLEHARKFFLPFADTFLPVWSLWAVGVVIPFVELF